MTFAKHMLCWGQQFVRQPVGIVFRLRDGRCCWVSFVIPFHQMEMKSKRSIPEERMESLLRGRWALAIEYFKRLRPEAIQDSSPQAPVIAQKMREFVGNRKPLFGIPIRSIDKGYAMAAPRHETRPKQAVFSRDFTHKSAMLQPIERRARAQLWQEHNG